MTVILLMLSQKKDGNKMKLSNQAMGAIMLALQKGVMEQVDITGLLRSFELSYDKEKDEITINNPPTISLEENATED